MPGGRLVFFVVLSTLLNVPFLLWLRSGEGTAGVETQRHIVLAMFVKDTVTGSGAA